MGLMARESGITLRFYVVFMKPVTRHCYGTKWPHVYACVVRKLGLLTYPFTTRGLIVLSDSADVACYDRCSMSTELRHSQLHACTSSSSGVGFRRLSVSQHLDSDAGQEC